MEAVQKMVELYHNERIVMLKFGRTLPISANISIHYSVHSKLCPFTEMENYLVEKKQKDMFAGPSIVFTRNAVVDKTSFQKLTNLGKSTAGIGASRFYI